MSQTVVAFILETASVDNKELEPDALGIPLHRLDFEDRGKGISQVDVLHMEIVEHGELESRDRRAAAHQRK